MGARHYESLSGRFINADPLGHGATPDLYSYALGDPINFFDPTGRIGVGMHDEKRAKAWSPSNHFLTQSDYHKSQGNGFRAMGYGFLGIMGAVPEIIDHTFSEAGREMGQVRQEIDHKINTGEYSGTQAVLARTLQNFGDMGLGNSSLVSGLMTSPIDTTSNVVTAIPDALGGVVNNAFEAYYDPSLSNTLDVIEDGINIGTFLYGAKTTLTTPTLDSGMTTVSRWGRDGLEPGDWVMNGNKNLWNYWFSGKIQPNWMYGDNKPSSYTSGKNYQVPSDSVRAPHKGDVGTDKDNAVTLKIKKLVGQRIYNPKN